MQRVVVNEYADRSLLGEQVRRVFDRAAQSIQPALIRLGCGPSSMRAGADFGVSLAACFKRSTVLLN